MRTVALLASLALAGCYRTVEVRVPEARTVESTHEAANGTELRLRRAPGGPEVLAFAVEEVPMCRRVERGTAQVKVERRSVRTDSIAARVENVIVYGVPLTVVGAMGIAHGGNTQGLFAAFLGLGLGVIGWAAAPGSRVVGEPKRVSEPFEDWAGDRISCGTARATPGITVRATALPPGGGSIDVSGTAGEDALVRIPVDRFTAVSAGGAPLQLRVEVPGVPDALHDDPRQPGTGRTQVPLDVVLGDAAR